MRVSLFSLIVVLGCSGGPTEGTPGPDGTPGTAGKSGKSGPDSEEDAEIRALGQTFADKLRDATVTCRAMIDPVDAEALLATPFSFDEAALDGACGGVAGLYDAESPALLGKARVLDSLVTHSARLGDDVAYLRRTLHHPQGEERKRALVHVREALARAADGISKYAQSTVRPYRAPKHVEGWALDTDNDARDVPNQRRLLQRYAFNQGFTPEQVRHRMLQAFATPLRVYADVRVASLAEVGFPPADLAKHQAYLTTLDACLDTFEGVTAAYVAGEVKDAATRDAWIAKADAALAAFQAAWAADRGLPFPPTDAVPALSVPQPVDELHPAGGPDVVAPGAPAAPAAPGSPAIPVTPAAPPAPPAPAPTP